MSAASCTGRRVKAPRPRLLTKLQAASLTKLLQPPAVGIVYQFFMAQRSSLLPAPCTRHASPRVLTPGPASDAPPSPAPCHQARPWGLRSKQPSLLLARSPACPAAWARLSRSPGGVPGGPSPFTVVPGSSVRYWLGCEAADPTRLTGPERKSPGDSRKTFSPCEIMGVASSFSKPRHCYLRMCVAWSFRSHCASGGVTARTQ